jgi:hypothetical protein
LVSIGKNAAVKAKTGEQNIKMHTNKAIKATVSCIFMG